jgi:GTP cyclohydrolase I
MTELVRRLLESIGEDPEREGLIETPRRFVEMVESLTAGYREDANKLVAGAIFPVEHDQMIVVKDILFYSLCVHGKSRVYTPTRACFAKDVRPGQQLLTLDPERKQLQLTEVLAVSTTKHRERYHLVFEEGYDLLATGEHPVFVLGRGFTPVRNVRPGYVLLGVHPKRVRRPEYPLLSLGYSLGYVLGALASDGSVDGGRRLRLEVNDPLFARKFATHLHQAFGIETKIEKIRKPSGFLHHDIEQYRVRVCSSFLTDLITKLLGGEMRSKAFHFPEVVRHNYETMQGFLEGYIDGDGYRIKNSQAHMVVSANQTFLARLAEILDTPVGQQNPGIGTVYVSPRWFEARRTSKGFKRGFVPEPQSHLLQATLERIRTQTYRVESVERQQATLKSFTMYNFECAPYNSYIVNGILAHNCEHHILPFFGRAHVGYIPDGRVIGMSKIPQIVEHFSKRLQLQERLSEEIAGFLMETLHPKGVGVIVEAVHLCMAMRELQKDAWLVTSAVKGIFRKDPRTRGEFLQLIGKRGL